jgi:RNA polymerase sigma-B factor
MTSVAAPSRIALRSSDSETQIRMLFRRCREEHDRDAREALVRRFLPLARRLARRYARSSEPYEDLAQVAFMGLVKAVDRFDTNCNSSFPAFAVPTILGELRRHFRDHTWSVHVPRSAQEHALAVTRATDRLTNENGHAPTVSELAQHLELSQENVVDGLAAAQAYEAQSLDAPARTERDDTLSIRETLGTDDDRYELVESAIAVSGAMKDLSERDHEILRLRFCEEMTQTQIAKRMGVSQMQISRLLRGSLERLRERASDRPSSCDGESKHRPSLPSGAGGEK